MAVREALVDTGATHCWFHADLAGLIGLDLADGERGNVDTGGGRVPGWWAYVSLEIVPLGLHLNPRAFFSSTREYPIIGISGAIDHFVLGLHHTDSRLFLGKDPYYDCGI